MAQNRIHPWETKKDVLNQYMALPQGKEEIMCEYIWIDGSGVGLRSKCRTLTFIPENPSGKYSNLTRWVCSLATKYSV